MFNPTTSVSGTAPVRYRTTNNYSTTFSGPITQDDRTQQSARNESMAKAAFTGDVRAYQGQAGQGVRAGSKQANYRAALQADSEANKGYAQAQQDLFNQHATDAGANLLFQQNLAGEQGWLRDLLLDRDDTRNRERMAVFKRKVDFELAAYQRRTEDAVARDRRKAQEAAAFWSSFL